MDDNKLLLSNNNTWAKKMLKHCIMFVFFVNFTIRMSSLLEYEANTRSMHFSIKQKEKIIFFFCYFSISKKIPIVKG